MNNVVGNPPRDIESPVLLLGEGKEEELFFGALVKSLGLPPVQIESYGGKKSLRLYLQALHTRPGFKILKTLIVTRDADEDYASALVSVQSALNESNLAGVQVERFILPGINRSGALENLCLDSLTDSPLLVCVNQYLECAVHAGFQASRKPAYGAKARVHAWLAAQDPPDLRLGQATSKLQFDAPAFSELREFLVRVLR